MYFKNITPYINGIDGIDGRIKSSIVLILKSKFQLKNKIYWANPM